MIIAVNKNGVEARFQERVWELLPPHKNGWMIKDSTAAVPKNIIIPKELIEYSAKKEAKKAEESEPPVSLAEMRRILTEKGVTFDPKANFLKTKKLYNESKK